MINIVQQRYSAQVCYITEVSILLKDNTAGCFDTYDIKNVQCIPYDPPGVKNVAMSNERMMTDDRHRGAINMLYLDGHAAAKRLNQTSKYDFRWIANGQNNP